MGADVSAVPVVDAGPSLTTQQMASTPDAGVASRSQVFASSATTQPVISAGAQAECSDLHVGMFYGRHSRTRRPTVKKPSRYC